MNIELKPCPFCGGEAYLRDFGAGFHSVCCWNRACAMTCETPVRTSAEKAITDWNTRAERTCRMDYVGYIGTEESHASIYQCSKCSMRYMSANVPDPGEYCLKCGAKVVDE